MTSYKRFLIALLVASSLAFSPAAIQAGDRPVPAHSSIAATKVGQLENPALKECSGMDASTLRDDLLWAINDGGNGAYLYAMGLNGEDRGRVRVRGAKNRDWEAVDAFRWKGVSYLLIADVGDNKARYESLTMHVVQEPQLIGDRFGSDAAVNTAWRFDFQFPDGARDAEGVAVDVTGEVIVIISKRDPKPRIYTLPLRPGDRGAPVIATHAGVIDHLPSPTLNDLLHPYGAFRSQPTAFDISPDGAHAVLLTYMNAYVFHRIIGRPWEARLQEHGRSLPLPQPEKTPDLPQREAICFGADNRTVYITSERIGAGIYTIQAK
jgi:hypothetical protein